MKKSWLHIRTKIVGSINSAMPSILILLLIGSLAGTWLLSGIVPTIIYYGLDIIHPKIFLFENVQGLLRAKWTSSGKKGEIFKDVLNTFKKIPNYHVKHKLVYAKDYGVPQNRPRVLIISKRRDVPWLRAKSALPRKSND